MRIVDSHNIHTAFWGTINMKIEKYERFNYGSKLREVIWHRGWKFFRGSGISGREFHCKGIFRDILWYWKDNG